MAFSFYYSLRMLPKDLHQVANLFQLSGMTALTKKHWLYGVTRIPTALGTLMTR